MADVPAPPFEELLWTIAMARHVFGAAMSLQAPPNLNTGRLEAIIAAGCNDWGGVSPVTVDHVNPESPWPQLDSLAAQTRAAGKTLVPRLTVYPHYIEKRAEWLHPGISRQRAETRRCERSRAQRRLVAGCRTGATAGCRYACRGVAAPGTAYVRLMERARAGERSALKTS
jgi:FO synthase